MKTVDQVPPGIRGEFAGRKPTRRAVIALAAVLSLAAFPAAAQGFDFKAWLDSLSTMNLPVMEIEHIDYGPYSEDGNLGNAAPLFRVGTRDGQTVKTDLPIGVSWTTATGRTGGGYSSTIPAGSNQSNPFVVPIPDDDISHNCNKLIVNLRSLQPDKYKIAPYVRGKGFEYVVYLNNDGGNPDGTLSDRCK